MSFAKSLTILLAIGLLSGCDQSEKTVADETVETLESALAGNLLLEEDFLDTGTLCGRRDDRRHSRTPEMGRLRINGYVCSATLISKSCLITAGHCFKRGLKGTVEFNVPKSRRGYVVSSSSENRYQLESSSIFYRNGGKGKDYGVFRVQPNNVTGKFPGEVQGHLDIQLAPARRNSRIDITGFGADRNSPSLNFAQQSHKGLLSFSSGSKLYYKVDTMGGNSGSAIVDIATGDIIGVHTHGGCKRRKGYNSGTSVSAEPAFREAILSCLAADNE